MNVFTNDRNLEAKSRLGSALMPDVAAAEQSLAAMAAVAEDFLELALGGELQLGPVFILGGNRLAFAATHVPVFAAIRSTAYDRGFTVRRPFFVVRPADTNETAECWPPLVYLLRMSH